MTDGGPLLVEMVAEMRRLSRIMLQANNNFLRREQQVIRLHNQGRQNYSGDLSTVLDNDLILRGYSGLAKTCAVLAGGLAQIIQAEIAISERYGDRI